MAFSDLTPTQQQQVTEFTRDYRAAVADVVRGLRRQQLLAMAYTSHIADLWAQINNADVIPDSSGLAGADLTMTKADFTPKFAWTQNLLLACTPTTAARWRRCGLTVKPWMATACNWPACRTSGRR